MRREVGLLVDQGKTVVVMVSGKDQRDWRSSDCLSKHCDKATTQIRAEESILILGPGGAKGKCAKQLQGEGVGECIAGFETFCRMTDCRIMAEARLRSS